ncbi:hypothetical protein ABZ819_09125 [Streptomyces venezuelae]|uniref:hypothetical protein n=1 Tax=Streptomyces venezuelae TaxID=54571 RepID=UPI0034225C5E
MVDARRVRGRRPRRSPSPPHPPSRSRDDPLDRKAHCDHVPHHGPRPSHPPAPPAGRQPDHCQAHPHPGGQLRPAHRARHALAPEVPLASAYANDIVATRCSDDGTISAPWLQADMLEAARIQPGHRVLEIGSGGYNAALIAELTGPTGLVATLDINRAVTDRATRFLAQTGCDHVRVFTADAEHRIPEASGGSMSGHRLPRRAGTPSRRRTRQAESARRGPFPPRLPRAVARRGPNPRKNFKVVYNPGPLGGRPGRLTPQGIITASVEYTPRAHAAC